MRRFVQNAISVSTNPEQLLAYLRWTVGRALFEPTRVIAGRKVRGFRNFSEYWNIAATTASEDEVRLIKHVVGNNRSPCLDVGANLGQMALMISSMTDQPIHCFEPHPATFSALSRNCDGPQFHVNRVAMSDRVGVVRFSDGRGSTLNRMLTGHSAGERSFEVPTDTLSDYLDRSGIERVSLVKIDVEGAEPLVLAGLRRHLDGRRVGGMLVEVVAENLANLGHTVEDIWTNTTPYGYWPYAVGNLTRRLSLDELAAVRVPNVAFLPDDTVSSS